MAINRKSISGASFAPSNTRYSIVKDREPYSSKCLRVRTNREIRPFPSGTSAVPDKNRDGGQIRRREELDQCPQHDGLPRLVAPSNTRLFS